MSDCHAPREPPHRPGLHPRHLMLALGAVLGSLYAADALAGLVIWSDMIVYVAPVFTVYLFAAMLVRLRDLRVWNRQRGLT